MSTVSPNSATEVILPEGTTGRTLRDQFHIAAAYSVAGAIELSGQTGHFPDLSLPETPGEEVTTAFANATDTLEAAGSGWQDLYAIRTYHVVPAGADSIPGEAIEAVLQSFAQLMPDHLPVWTAIAVPALAFPGMTVEIELTATSS